MYNMHSYQPTLGGTLIQKAILRDNGMLLHLSLSGESFQRSGYVIFICYFT